VAMQRMAGYDNLMPVINLDRCTGCGDCAGVNCPYGAIIILGGEK